MLAYNYWARDKVLAGMAWVGEGDLGAPAGLSYGSMLGALTHTLNAEHVWRMRCQHNLSPTSVKFVNAIDTVARLQGEWQVEETEMRAYFVTLADADLARTVSYAGLRGQTYSNPVWQILVHMFAHGVQHRTEVAAKLDEHGVSLGNLDFVIYLRGQ